MNERSVTYNGKEYISAREFADRVNATPQTITRYIRDGLLTAHDVQKTGVKYLDWQTQSVAYRVIRGKKNAKGGGGRKKKSSTLVRDKSISSPCVNNLNAVMENNAMPEINSSEPIIDLSTINPYEHKDCWILDGNNLPIKDPDGRPKLDYEQLKTKITVMTYQVKLDKEVGSLIPKEELISTIQGVSTVFKSNVDNIAQKYAAPLIAICESITGHEFTSAEHTMVMNILRNVPKEIFPTIQAELEKMIENVEQN